MSRPRSKCTDGLKAPDTPLKSQQMRPASERTINPHLALELLSLRNIDRA
jgi:hypothetical protein